MKNQQLSIKHNHGFTLLELIIVIIILSIIAAGSTALLYQGFNTYFVTQNIIAPQAQARTAIEILTRDLRAIRSPTDIMGVTSTSANNIQFIDINNRIIYYQLAGNLLQRRIDTPSAQGSYQTLASNATNFTIYYYDSSDQPTSTNSSIRYIYITLTININNIPFTLKTGVYPWNLY